MPVVDELSIKLTLEAGDLQRGLELFISKIAEAAQVIGQALGEGVAQAMQEVGQAAGEAGNAGQEAAEAMAQVGEAAQEAGRQGAEGMRQIARESRRTRQQMSSDARMIENVSRRITSRIKALVMKFAAPIAGAFAIGSMANNYISDLGKVAELTGTYNKQLEEERKKKAMLQRVTKEDLELYKKSREALVNFQLATQSLGNALMRAFGPAIEKIAGWLNRFSDFIERNQDNIVRFCKVAAGVIGTILIPAFVALGIAMLKSPFTWVVLAILALILVIDDLVTYIQGGESQLEGLWKEFGTGKEIAEKLKKAWEGIKHVFTEILPKLAPVLAGFLAFKAAAGTIATFGKIAGAVKLIVTNIGLATSSWKLLTGLFATNPIAAACAVIAAAAVAIWQNWDIICEKVQKAIGFLKEWKAAVFDGAMHQRWTPNGKQIEVYKDEQGNNQWRVIPSAGQAAAARSASGGGGPVTNNNQRSMQQTNKIDVHVTPAPGANGSQIGSQIGKAILPDLTKAANTGNGD